MSNLLQAGAVELRALEESDGGLFSDWFSDGNFVESSGVRYPKSRQAWTEWVSANDMVGQNLAVFLFGLRGQESVGMCSLRGATPEDRCAEIAIGIASPDTRKKGIAYAAGYALVRFGFEVMGLNRIQASIVEGNESSIRLCEAASFTFEGTSRASRFSAGEFRNILHYSLLASEFQQFRPPR